MNHELEWMREVLSPARLAPYLAKAGNDLTAAGDLYWWNVEASAAFYAPLHCVEVALRNALHAKLTARFGQADWWELAPLNADGLRLVKEAKNKIESRGRLAAADDVVAGLSLGFWVALVSRGYDRSLWVPFLHKAFPRFKGSRQKLYGELQTVRLFRNRIMHHEPIHHRHLEADHQTILRVLHYLSPELTTRPAVTDGVTAVLRRRPRRPGPDAGNPR